MCYNGCQTICERWIFSQIRLERIVFMKKQSNKPVINKRMPYVSPTVQGAPPRFKPGTFTKAISIFLVVVSLCLLAIWGLQKAGYRLIRSSIFYYLLLADIAGALVWAVYGARKLVKRPPLKRTMTVSATVLAALVMFYVFTYVSASITYLNNEMGRSKSPNGENELVILRSYYIDLERMLDEAHEAYPDYTDDEIEKIIAERLKSGGDPNIFSYVYMAYPVRAGIFYYTNVEVGPDLLIIAQDSDATLSVRWEDEDSAALYAQNPGPYDRGEFTVKCK